MTSFAPFTIPCSFWSIFFPNVLHQETYTNHKPRVKRVINTGHWTLACILLFSISNVTTNLFSTNFRSGDTYFGSWTLGFVIVPSFFISLFTFILHKKSNGRFLMKIHVSKPLVYSLCAILHGHIARCVMWLALLMRKETLFGVRKALWAFRDITSYAETFTHSLPQLCLQLYVMVIYTGSPTGLQLLSFISSLLSAAWAIHSQFQGIRWKLLSFEINLCWFASRAAASILLASVYKSAPFWLLAIHFLLMFPLWFWQKSLKPFRKKRGTSRFELIITDVFYAGIYAGSNTATPITCKYQLPLAIVLLVENLVCIFVGLQFGNIYRPKDHFKNFQTDYKIEDLKLFFDSCREEMRHKGDSYIRFCRVGFVRWVKSHITFTFALTLTILGFLQVIIVVFLRYRKIIDEDAMVSKLGDSRNNRRSHTSDGKKGDSILVAVMTTATDTSMSPRASPTIPGRQLPSQQT